jgi:hypothetical protein
LQLTTGLSLARYQSAQIRFYKLCRSRRVRGVSSQPAVFSKGATFPPESARGLPRTLFSDVYGYCAGTIWHPSVVAAFAFLQFGPDTVASDGGASSQKSIEQRVPIGATACHLGGVYALGSSVRSIAMATAPSRHPLLRWRPICLPAVPWFVLCEPTTDDTALPLGTGS